jgi:nucleoid-associated protein YgaU
MRRDVKTGMLAGTVLCLVAIVWFCAKQQIVTGPLTKFESQSLTVPTNKEPTDSENAAPTVIAPAYRAAAGFAPTSEQKQRQAQKSDFGELSQADSAPADKNTGTSIIHTVVQGQTLIDISKIYYNTPYGWGKIYEANKEHLAQGPNMIRAGMRLLIP